LFYFVLFFSRMAECLCLFCLWKTFVSVFQIFSPLPFLIILLVSPQRIRLLKI
jgi:hypothetical protein